MNDSKPREVLTRGSRDIRTLEKRFYRKIIDIYTLSVDYDPTNDISFTLNVKLIISWFLNHIMPCCIFKQSFIIQGNYHLFFTK